MQAVAGNTVVVEIQEVPAYLHRHDRSSWYAIVPALRLATRGDTRGGAIRAAEDYLSCFGVKYITIADKPPMTLEEYHRPIFQSQ